MAKRSNIEVRGGRNHTFPVSAGLLEPRHVQAIDASSPWPIYLWFLNRVTRDEANGEPFDGIVLNGKPVGIEQIAAELGMGYHICRRHIAHLVRNRYILQKKTGTGMCAYVVTKSKKWAWQRNGEASGPTEQKVASGIPTEQNLLSGSRDRQSGILSVGDDPQSGICNATEQKVLSAIRKEHRKSHSTKPQTSLAHSSNEQPTKAAFFPASEVEAQSKVKPTPTSKAKPSAPGTRIPAAFAPTEEHCALARALGLDIEWELAKFCDYWKAKAGKDGVKLDWDATFRNWLRKAAEMNQNGVRKSVSKYNNFEQVDYTRGLGERNADGTYKF